MHILYVAKQYFANPDLVRLSEEIAHRNHDVSVVTSFRSFDKQEYRRNISIFEVNPLITIHSIGYKVAFPCARIYRIIKELHVEIVHALNDYSAHTASAAVASRLANVPFVYTVQGVGTRTESLVVDTLIKLYDRTVKSQIAKSAQKVILLSKSLISRARELGVDDSKTAIIPSGIDHAYFDPERHEVEEKAELLREKLDVNDSIVVGYIGRLIPAKGLVYLISAIKQIQGEHPHIALVIVGDGPQRKTLEIMAKNLGIKSIFTGWQVNTLPFYALMDIFVLPSFFEGLPNVILEAMAMEKPIVAAHVGGVPDLVMNGKNGFLVPVRDYKSIAEALKVLITNRNLRKRMGKLNRQIVKESFSWDKIVGKVETVYNELV